MGSVLRERPAVKPVDDVRALWAEHGWQPGAPFLSDATVKVDMRICKRAACQACDNRGLTWHPFHRATRYRVLAVCVRCGHAQEF